MKKIMFRRNSIAVQRRISHEYGMKNSFQVSFILNFNGYFNYDEKG